MSLSVYKCYEYSHTHENEQFRVLAELLAKKYHNREDKYLLIGNVSLNGNEMDAILFKPNAIIILEFKNYGGRLSYASENGDWLLDDNTIVKGGGSGKNPFTQTKSNRWAAIQFFDNNVQFNNVEYKHISGVVVFNQDIDDAGAEFSPNIRSWFHISDMRHIVNKIDDISSPQINLSVQDIESIPSVLGLNERQLFDLGDLLPFQALPAALPQTNFQDGIRQCIADSGYTIVHEKFTGAKTGERMDHTPLNLSQSACRVLNDRYNGQIWRHQYEAIDLVKQGRNVCIATATSSGKTLVFQIAALETLSADNEARILAIYPQKSLSAQQFGRWNEILPNQVGIIDGNHNDLEERRNALRNARVIVMTPDSVHACILGSLNNDRTGALIMNFLRSLKLVIVDEIHSYTGVFGTNSQYMFRRLNMCVDLCKGTQQEAYIPLQYITASATIKDPDLHSQRITNVEYSLIDQTYSDVSARYTYLLRCGAQARVQGSLNSLFAQFVTNLPDKKFISFIDSRQTVARTGQQVNEILEQMKLPRSVLSYRSGYELEDSNTISVQIRQNQFSGLISTSAMEIGIDLPQLDIVVLYGVPENATSYYQRIGRVGRTGGGGECVAIIVDNGTFQTSKVFDNPSLINNLPIIEAALYSSNEKVINRNLKCIYDGGNGEYPYCGGNTRDDNVRTIMDKHFSSVGANQTPFSSICYDWISNNQAPTNYVDDTSGVGNPNFEFSLRSFDAQFAVRNLNRTGRITNPDKGSINFNTLIREAYPGAIWEYNHASRWRVCRVDWRGNTVYLFDNRERNIYRITRPMYSAIVIPQGRNVHRYTAQNVRIYNSEILVREQTRGFKEKIGNGEWTVYEYPLQEEGDPTRYDSNVFSREFNTSGVLIFHDSLDVVGVECLKISQLLYEIFLQCCAFERSEVSFVKPNVNNVVEGGHKYIGLYDNVVGGLCITNRLLEDKVLAKAFEVLDNVVSNGTDEYILEYPIQKQSTRDAIRAIKEDLNSVATLINENAAQTDNANNNRFVDVIAPTSVGAMGDDGAEVTINFVYFDRNEDSVMYEYMDAQNQMKSCTINEIEPIIGRSEKVQFDLIRTMLLLNNRTIW